MENPDLVMNKEMLKAISTESRMGILRALVERQKTQTELASELKLSAPTVLEHVQHLEKAGLIERVKEDKERKWKYYQLTKTGKKLAEKRPLNILLLLAASSLAIFGGLVLFRPSSAPVEMNAAPVEYSAEVSDSALSIAAKAAPPEPSFSTFDLAIIIFGIITVVLLGVYLFKILKNRK